MNAFETSNYRNRDVMDAMQLFNAWTSMGGTSSVLVVNDRARLK